MKHKPEPTLLRAILEYNPQDGRLFWRHRPAGMFSKPADANAWNARYAGRQAFTADDGGGYRCGGIFGVRYLAHRVIWAMQTGAWPTEEVDHENGVHDDNRWENLRSATRGQNAKNLGLSARNKSGCKGVCWDKDRQSWSAEILADGRKVRLGRFETVDAASAAYRKASREMHGAFRREAAQ